MYHGHAFAHPSFYYVRPPAAAPATAAPPQPEGLPPGVVQPPLLPLDAWWMVDVDPMSGLVRKGAVSRDGSFAATHDLSRSLPSLSSSPAVR